MRIPEYPNEKCATPQDRNKCYLYLQTNIEKKCFNSCPFNTIGNESTLICEEIECNKRKIDSENNSCSLKGDDDKEEKCYSYL
jgi:hypothetical protein